MKLKKLIQLIWNFALLKPNKGKLKSRLKNIYLEMLN